MKKVIFILFAVTGACARFQSSEKPNFYAFEEGQPLAEVTNKAIREVSGLAASVNNPGLFWAHNDSGHDAEIFLVDEQLNIQCTLILQGIKNRDWEDITVGPGPDSFHQYIYVGDIGDNMARHDYKYIYRFPEPKAGEEDSLLAITEFDTITFRLPYERQDTETLMVDPLTKELYVVTKREKSVTVYRIENSIESNPVTAETVATLDITGVVAGAFSPDGGEILMKNIYNVYYWKRSEGENIEDVLKQKPKILPYKAEPQGEAMTFARDGSGYYTISEVVRGERSFLHFYKRKQP